MDIETVEAAFTAVATAADGRLKRGLPSGQDGFFYIGCGDKGEKYTLRHMSQWRDSHWQDNLEHLGADPERALHKALALTGNKPVYFEPFVLRPGCRGPRPQIPMEKQRITFGQYQGKTFEFLLEKDRGYLEWLAGSARDASVKAIARSLVGMPDSEASETPISDWPSYVVRFGKHRGKTLGDLLRDDPNYLFWLAKNAHEDQVRQGVRSLLGPCDVPFMAVDVASVLSEAGLLVRRDDDGWAVHGNTYPIRNLLEFLGGRYDADNKRYCFRENSPLEPLVLSIVDVDKLDTVDRDKMDPDGAPARARARKARLDFDGQEDCRLSDQDYAGMVSPGTVALLQRGLDFGIPQGVINEQIADAGRIVDAFSRGEPLFLLASEAGAGKTFVLGAAAREILLRAPDIRFCYVTLRKGLIKQIQSDLQDYNILQAFDFHTYSAIGKAVPGCDQNTIAIFDEAHTAKNLESKAGSAAASMASGAQLAIYASATPYEDPSEMAYLAASGLFDPHGFEAFAMGYGATPERKLTPNGYGGSRVTTRVVWRNSTESLQAAAAGRQYLQKRGIYTQRKKRLPLGMVSSQFHKVAADPKWIDMFQHVSEAYDYAAEISAEMGGNPQMLFAHKRNLQKRILEAAKIQGAIALAKAAAGDSRQSVMFVETKAQRYIGNTVPFHELLAIYTFWAAFPPNEREYPPPVTLNQLALAQAFKERKVEYRLPSVVDEIVMALGRESTGVYVGARAFETLTVTDASADRELAAWKAGKLPFLVATMAKGGTGLSLHPVKKKQPRLQIGINLPWKAYGVDQVSGRCARYGMLSEVAVDWLFCPDIPLERELATKVGARMAGMGASVSGITTDMSERLMEWDMEAGLDVNYQGFTEV